MYKLVFFVPQEHIEAVKCAIFNEGAGRIGNYDQCCWQTKGQGQFRPLDGSSPYLGRRDSLEVVEEYRVELVCENALIRAVVKALIAAHPYEEPAYEIYKLESL
ncbi:MAG: YqfO family protein [Gammaproteobacteria bacterium]|nr:YqfO family protein [Gammaproteobacteria bacterium]